MFNFDGMKASCKGWYEAQMLQGRFAVLRARARHFQLGA